MVVEVPPREHFPTHQAPPRLSDDCLAVGGGGSQCRDDGRPRVDDPVVAELLLSRAGLLAYVTVEDNWWGRGRLVIIIINVTGRCLLLACWLLSVEMRGGGARGSSCLFTRPKPVERPFNTGARASEGGRRGWRYRPIGAIFRRKRKWQNMKGKRKRNKVNMKDKMKANVSRDKLGYRASLGSFCWPCSP
jgi:hypothetical protein